MPFLVAGAFFLFFFVRARREGTSVRESLARRNAHRTYRPGWWKPTAVLLAVLIVVFIAYTSAEHGFRWNYLLVIPILGGFFAIGTAALSWLLRRA